MKIAIVSRALPEHRSGGLEHHVHDLANALVRRGREVHLFTTCPSGALAGSPEALYTVHRVPGTVPGDYSVAFFRSADEAVRQVHEKEKFDLVHTHDFAGLFFRPPGSVPWVETVHGTLFSETPLDWRYRCCQSMLANFAAAVRCSARFALMPAFRRMLERCDAVAVDSDFTRRELAAGYPRVREKVRIVPLGIEPPEQQNGQGDFRDPGALFPRILLLGRLQERKGIGMALRAASILSNRDIPFHITVAGKGDYLHDAKNFITKSGLADRVDLTGYVPEEKIDALYRAHDVFLFPDLTHPAFGLVALEAMSRGLPVAGARSGAIPETVSSETGWLYDPWNVSALVEILTDIATNRESCKRKSAAALAFASRFSADAMAANMEKVYDGVKACRKKH